MVPRCNVTALRLCKLVAQVMSSLSSSTLMRQWLLSATHSRIIWSHGFATLQMTILMVKSCMTTVSWRHTTVQQADSAFSATVH